MAFKVECECGRTHEVTATLAGTSLACRACGKQMAIPLLSELRAQAGQDRYITNAAEKVARLLRNDFVPPGACCLSCGCRTSQVMRSKLVCERVWRAEKLSNASWVALILMALFLPFGWLAALILGGRDAERDTRERGRDVIVPTPIRLCGNCAELGPALNLAQLRLQLQKVPEYAELIAEYPQAEIMRD